MYSVVMMVALTSGGESVDFCFRNRGCSSSCSVSVAPVYTGTPVCTGTVVHSAPVADCCSSSHGCSGRQGLFSRLFHHKNNDCCSAPVNTCHGANDCCSGSRGGFLRRLFHRDNDCCSSAPVYAAPCSGSVVVPAGCTAH